MSEKITPVTPDEVDDIRVTLNTDDGDIECRPLTIFEVDGQDYIALMHLMKMIRTMQKVSYISTDIQKMNRDLQNFVISMMKMNMKQFLIVSTNYRMKHSTILSKTNNEIVH